MDTKLKGLNIGLSRELIALRVAAELTDGMYVNLGNGIASMVANYISDDSGVMVQCENGILGFGPAPSEDQYDIDLVNANGQPITLLPGASFSHHADSFAMIRGGHLDAAVLGAYQVSEHGDLANWKVPSLAYAGIGGAMDLARGVKRLIIAMEHTTPRGEPKIVKECSYPLTGRHVVNTIITNLALIEVTAEGLLLKEVAPGVEPEQVQRHTEPTLIISPLVREMSL